MNNLEILEILTDWNFWGNFKVDLNFRRMYINEIALILTPTKATVIKGIRRSGKSYLVYSLFVDMFNSEKDPFKVRDTLIINCEDPRLFNLESKDLLDIYEIFIEEVSFSNSPIVLLDEVQNVRGWERFVRYLIETKKIRVIITGSSSKLLSTEYASTLGGRYLDLEVFPLSYKEFLLFKGIFKEDDFDESGAMPLLKILKKKANVKKAAKEYMQFGGFPEVVLEENRHKKKLILLNYIQTIITKDISLRFEIRNMQKLSEMLKIYLSNIATLQSINNISKTIKLSPETTQKYSEYFHSVRLLYFIPKISFSMKKQILAHKKVYCIDTGIALQYGFSFIENLGRYLENMVAIELIRRYGESNIFYWQDSQQHEVDFVVVLGDKISSLIQVAYNLTDKKTKKREIRSLIYAQKYLNCKNIQLITWNEDSEENIDDMKISIIPFWKWILLPLAK
ncbi:MAG: ATP-binding protein [Promethearchaeota archaeon]